MRIASLVLQAKPEHFAGLRDALGAIPGVEVHGESVENGRLIVSIEDGEGYSVMDSMIAVSLTKEVLGTTLAYEYTDEGLELLEA